MRKVEIIDDDITITDDVECVIEKRATPFGNGAKVDCPKKYLGNRVYLVVLKD